jgi:hypothetical protein
MPLQFLVPLFLAGLAAVAIPIFVHLTRKQRAKVIEFPSLMFLERVPFQAESRRKIHHWLLLLARALAVILIVAAFSRPFFQDAELASGATSGPRELVVLLDRSYSMGIGDHWERAIAAAREATRQLGPLDRASLVSFARSADVVIRSTVDRTRFTSALDTLQVSDQGTSYGPALKLAQTILEESELPATELVLIGDFQRTGWTGEEGVSLPAGTLVTPVSVGSEAPENWAVSAVSLSRQRFSGRDRITPTARVTRLGGEEPVNVELVLEVDGREVQRNTVELPAEGAANVTFEPFTLAERHTRGSVRIATEDALVPDDAYYFVSSPGRALSVRILEDPQNRGASSLFLRRALSISQENVFEVTVQATGSPSAGDLGTANVLMVNDRPLAANSATAVRRFVEDGGGLIVVLGERISWPAELGDLLPGAFTGPVDREEGRGGRLGQLQYDHPIFEVFRGPRSGDFTGARFFRARGLTVESSDSVSVLARYDDGSVALAERLFGEGRVLVWTSTLDAFWNDLAVQPVFLPFVHQLVWHASGRTETLASFQAGQILDVSDARAMETAGLGEAVGTIEGEGELVTVTPGGSTTSLPAGEGPRFLRLEEQGFYEIRPPGGDGARPLAVAVNVDPSEADLGSLDVEEVVASIAAGAGDRPVPGGGDARTERLRREDQERRQSLWRLLLMGAFGLLALETLLSNRVSRAVRRESHAHA